MLVILDSRFLLMVMLASSVVLVTVNLVKILVFALFVFLDTVLLVELVFNVLLPTVSSAALPIFVMLALETSPLLTQELSVKSASTPAKPAEPMVSA